MSLIRLFAISLVLISLAAPAIAGEETPRPRFLELNSKTINSHAAQILVIKNRIARSHGLEIDVTGIDIDEIRAMALNVYHESRSEDLIGQIAVANVTMNRVASKTYPDSVEDVVYQRKQFSWTLRRNLVEDDLDAFRQAVDVALLVMSGKTKDVTGGALHYYAPEEMKCKCEPAWAKTMVETITIGGHVFMIKSDKQA